MRLPIRARSVNGHNFPYRVRSFITRVTYPPGTFCRSMSIVGENREGRQKGVVATRHSHDAALESVTRSFGMERVLLSRRISFEFPQASNNEFSNIYHALLSSFQSLGLRFLFIMKITGKINFKNSVCFLQYIKLIEKCITEYIACITDI